MGRSNPASSSREQTTSGSSSRSVLSESEERALKLWLERGFRYARDLDAEDIPRGKLGLSVWSYVPGTLNGLQTICRSIATKFEPLSRHADATERAITSAAQNLLKISRAEDRPEVYHSDYMTFHRSVDTALKSLYTYAREHDRDGGSVYLLQQVTNRLRPHEAEREAPGLISWVGSYLRSETDARNLDAANERWAQECRIREDENESLRKQNQELSRRLGLLVTPKSTGSTVQTPSVPRTIEPNSRTLPLHTRRPATPFTRSESRASQGSSSQLPR